MSSLPVFQPSAASQTIDGDLRRIEQLYKFRSPGIIDFLTEQPNRIKFLVDAYSQVEKYFGKTPQITLKLELDREYTGPLELFAYIATDLPVDQALGRLNEFDEQWYLNQSREYIEHIIFSLEFV